MLDEASRKRPRLQPCVDSDFWGLGPRDGDFTSTDFTPTGRQKQKLA